MDNLSLIAGLQIYGVESITHTHTVYHAVENVGGGVKKKVMRNPYKNTKFVLHFIYMCVCVMMDFIMQRI